MKEEGKNEYYSEEGKKLHCCRRRLVRSMPGSHQTWFPAFQRW